MTTDPAAPLIRTSAADTAGGSGRVWRAAAVFVAASYLVTWAVWAPLLLNAVAGLHLPTFGLQFYLGSFGPLVGAAMAALFLGGPDEVRRWARRAYSVRETGRWMLWAPAMACGYVVIAVVVTRITTGAFPDLLRIGVTDKLPGLSTFAVLAVLVVTFGLGEESGWRGWLLPILTMRLSIVRATLVVAVVWIVWHLPAFFFNPTYEAMGPAVFGWIISLVAGAYLLSWMAVSARWSVIPLVLWHAGFDLITGADAASGMVAGTVSAIVIVQGVIAAGVLIRRQRAGTVSPPGAG